MLKQLLRELTPPIVFSAVRKIYRYGRVGTPIFDGLYIDRSALPVIQEDAFAHPNWISYVIERARSRKAGVSNQDMHEMCLSLIGSLLIDKPATGGPLKAIVDFGGGVGMYWTVFKAQDKGVVKHDFTVVDNARNCIAGRSLFGNDEVRFESDFESAIAGQGIHLLNVAGTLHYCLDYEAVIDMLCRSAARFIVVSRHPAPADGLAIAYTVQNIVTIKGACGRIPVVLLAVDRLVSLMQDRGYQLIADYYSDADPGKYWAGSNSRRDDSYDRIIDHALVFQKLSSQEHDGSC